MQHRMTFGIEASSSRRSKPPSPPQDEEEDENVIYSYAPEVASTLDASKLTTLVGRYQIPNEFRPHLPKSGEWCCSPLSGFGVYTSYLLIGLRLPLNSFYRGLFHRLGIGPNQLIPNGWRTKRTKRRTWPVVLKEKKTSRFRMHPLHQSSRSLSSRLGREKAFQAALTLVIFQDAEVLRNKSSIRLLPQGSKASNHHGRPRRPGSELDARPSYSFIHPA